MPPFGMPGMNGQPQEAQEEKTTTVKTMFRQGDSLNETGYVVDTIDPAQNLVVLKRGVEEVELKIELNSKQESVRRQNVIAAQTSEAERLKKVTQGEEKQEGANQAGNDPRMNRRGMGRWGGGPGGFGPGFGPGGFGPGFGPGGMGPGGGNMPNAQGPSNAPNAQNGGQPGAAGNAANGGNAQPSAGGEGRFSRSGSNMLRRYQSRTAN